jgi:polysaccharide export outer membrane protein
MFRDIFPRSSEVFWKRVAVLLVLPVLFAAVAPAQNPAPGTPAPPPSATKPLPGLDDPAISGAQVDPGTYIIGANDVLNVNVFHDRDWTGLYPVRTDGMITVATFGEMKAEGLTPRQLEKQLTEVLSEKLKDPEVTVGLYEVRSKKYTITGQVKRPGSYPLIRATTVFEAINDASFLDTFANQGDILILRGDKTFHFSWKDYVKGKNRDKNIPLQNGDTIVVK